MVRNCECTVREVAHEKWDELLQQFPNHTVFHTLPWLKTICTVHGANLVLARADFDGRCVAVWPVLTTRKGPLRVMGSPLPGWSTAYMGPLFAPDSNVQMALNHFLSHDLFRKGVYFAAKVLTDGPEVDLAPHGFVQVWQFDTYCLDLTPSEETLWNNLKSECRTRIRKARQLGLEVRQEQDDSFIDEYWSMSIDTFANTHIQPTFTRPFLEEMWRSLHPIGKVFALSAFRGDERIGTLVLPFDQRTMYYWSGASYLRNRGIPAHNLLHWEAFVLAQKLGIQRYDFISTLGGAGRFKRTFGPQAVQSAIHWERTSSRLIKTLKDRYEQYLTFKQKLKPSRTILGVLNRLNPLCLGAQLWDSFTESILHFSPLMQSPCAQAVCLL